MGSKAKIACRHNIYQRKKCHTGMSDAWYAGPWYAGPITYHGRTGLRRRVFAEMYQTLKKGEYHYAKDGQNHEAKQLQYERFLKRKFFLCAPAPRYLRDAPAGRRSRCPGCTGSRSADRPNAGTDHRRSMTRRGPPGQCRKPIQPGPSAHQPSKLRASPSTTPIHSRACRTGPRHWLHNSLPLMSRSRISPPDNSPGCRRYNSFPS